jgi:predicted ArsR family transcriptional regulator
MRGEGSALRDLALKALRRLGPMTADECAEAIGATPLSLRPRFSELRKAHRIGATGLHRANASGRSANVWKLVRRR